MQTYKFYNIDLIQTFNPTNNLGHNEFHIHELGFEPPPNGFAFPSVYHFINITDITNPQNVRITSPVPPGYLTIRRGDHFQIAHVEGGIGGMTFFITTSPTD